MSRPLRLAAALLTAALSSCTLGAPPGFSSGDSWSFPLVGPLEGGPLLVPVMFDGKGPYLFAIDPDSPVSQVDVALASELGLRTGFGPEFLDEGDKARQVRTAEVLRITLGTLTVRNLLCWASDVGTFNTGGRQVRGVIGKDILADSLVFGFDRQRGLAYLATKKGFQPPAAAATLSWRPQRSRLSAAVPRRLARAQVNGVDQLVHLDLGDVHSQLRAARWDAAKLTPIPVERKLVDEVGTRRTTTQAGLATSVTLGGVDGGEVLFVPYADARWEAVEYDGTLGLNFFDDRVVWADFDDHVLHVAAASQVAPAERIARWGSAQLDACATPGCTTAALLVPEPPPEPPPPDGATAGDAAASRPAPPPAKPVLLVERDPSVTGLAFEVTLEARAASGAPAGLPRLIAIFGPGEPRVIQPLDDRYAGLAFATVDVSPFPRTCASGSACVYVLGEVK